MLVFCAEDVFFALTILTVYGSIKHAKDGWITPSVFLLVWRGFRPLPSKGSLCDPAVSCGGILEANEKPTSLWDIDSREFILAGLFFMYSATTFCTRPGLPNV
jgi:hypothetical protein